MSELNIQPGLVSTIIPVFNRPELVCDAVKSVLRQTYRPIEIIVVDDGSTDNTPNVLTSLAKKHPEIVVLSQSNTGPGKARELGRQTAKGEYIQFLDSDDLLLPEKFCLQVAALLVDQNCDVAYGKTEMVQINESLKGIAMRETGTEKKTMFPSFLKSRWWGTSTPLYRHSVISQVGTWLSISNEEDWEYDCRIASLGGRLSYVDEFVSIARQHDDHLSMNGSIDPVKLKHRCVAQTHIYRHALSFMELEKQPSQIEQEDWAFYSKAVFLLARQCASANLIEQAKEMMSLSIKAQGHSTLKHKLFGFLAAIVGWKRASQLMQSLGK